MADGFSTCPPNDFTRGLEWILAAAGDGLRARKSGICRMAEGAQVARAKKKVSNHWKYMSYCRDRFRSLIFICSPDSILQ